MTNNIFTNKLEQPDEETLSTVLGKSYKNWQAVKKHIEDNYGSCAEEWKFYGQKIGWSLKIFLKKRNLFFVTVCNGFFRISFVLGNKAVAAAEQSKLPQTIIEELLNAKKYAEGRGVRIEVKSQKDVETIKQLVDIKIEN
ncbi:MAG: DUF3788 domain-containing protein [Ignavibacteriales bacterium]|nr:DUF3788 domain-containing protein [Ignavibacteriales bacterium]